MTKADLIAVIADKLKLPLRERVHQSRADLVSNANPTIPPAA
jgi:hypothetical protein